MFFPYDASKVMYASGTRTAHQLAHSHIGRPAGVFACCKEKVPTDGGAINHMDDGVVKRFTNSSTALPTAGAISGTSTRCMFAGSLCVGTEEIYRFVAAVSNTTKRTQQQTKENHSILVTVRTDSSNSLRTPPRARSLRLS